MLQPGTIKIKNIGVLRGLMEHNYHPMLVDIICWVADTYGIVMTESYRDKLHPNDLHGTDPVRATDLRSWCYAGDRAEEIAAAINRRYTYDHARPQMKVAIIHDSGRGVHFHIQVHPRTTLR